MSIPDWLVPLLQQFPIVGLVLGVAWLTTKWLDRRLDGELQRQKERAAEAITRADAEIARVREDKKQADRKNEAEIQRLAKQYEGEITRLRKRIDVLEERLEERDGG